MHVNFEYLQATFKKYIHIVDGIFNVGLADDRFVGQFTILLEGNESTPSYIDSYIDRQLHMHTNQTLRVKWGHTVSDMFNVMNGVKQGGVLSPILFAIYTDVLLQRLQETGVGCCCCCLPFDVACPLVQ